MYYIMYIIRYDYDFTSDRRLKIKLIDSQNYRVSTAT